MASSQNTLELPDNLLNAVLSQSPSEGFTHTFYRYPARFSPEFARIAIQTFSNPGDVVLDPFMGSGTTLIEAAIARRHAIGTDISTLAYFISQVKTTILSDEDFAVIDRWLRKTLPKLNLWLPARRDTEWVERGYQKDLPWPIRKTIELALHEVDSLPTIEQQNLARCALLSTGQWAIDCTTTTPKASAFREKFAERIHEFFEGIREMREAITAGGEARPHIVCLNTPAAELEEVWIDRIQKKPNLVVTSPPYPSVHVLYHRWQVKGRRETPSPFWIADKLDGNGGSYYTMGSRTPKGLDTYFRSIETAFNKVHALLAEDALVVQLIAFTDVDTQLPRYLTAMEHAGFQEFELSTENDTASGRVWRQVPLRRWYAMYKGNTPASKELLLIHKRAS